VKGFNKLEVSDFENELEVSGVRGANSEASHLTISHFTLKMTAISMFLKNEEPA
jgi:hypothetical protein